MLAESALAHGTPVVFMARNGPDFLAGLLALWRDGLVPVLVDPATPRSAVDRLAAAVHAPVLLTADAAWPRPCAFQTVALGHDAQPLPGVALVKTTSGTTGAPAGIAVTAQALLADAAALASTMGIQPQDRVVAAVPMSFSYGIGSLVVPALTQGVTLVVPRDATPLDAVAAVSRHAATVLPTVPILIRALAERADEPPLPASLRLVLTAGSPLAPDVARAFRVRFGRAVHVFYGTSETGGITFDRTGESAERGTVGTAVDGVAVTIGVDDAVVVASPALGHAYVGACGREFPAGGFATGDRGVLENGELRLLGRRCDSINVDGHKVSPREIESVLASHPDVADVVVTGAARPGREFARAFVASRSGALTRADVVAWCLRHLPPYKVPHAIRFVTEIPRNARGKVDLASLERLATP